MNFKMGLHRPKIAEIPKFCLKCLKKLKYCVSKLKSNTVSFLNTFQNTIMGILVEAVPDTN